MPENMEGLCTTKTVCAQSVLSGAFNTSNQYTSRLGDQRIGNELGDIQALSVAINKGLEERFVVGDGLQDAAITGDIADRPLAQSCAA